MKGTPTPYAAFRIDPAILARVEALGPRYTRPWRKATRSDLLRICILAGLDALENQKPVWKLIAEGTLPKPRARRSLNTRTE